MNLLQQQDPASIDPLARTGLYDRIGSGVGVGAAVDEMLTSPGSALGLDRLTQQRLAELGTPTRAGTYVQQPGSAGYSPLLDAATAEERYAVPGYLTFKDRGANGVRQREAELLHGWAIERAKREEILARADQSAAAQGARIGAAMLAAVLDPVNLAASVIPVLGEARYAWLAAKLGSRFGRLAGGAIEGALGTAAIEPLALLQAQAQQLDYDATDSFRNVLFGAALGGGLHLMFGRTPPADLETRRGVLPETNGAPLGRGAGRGAYRDYLTSTSALVDSLPAERRAAYLAGAIDDLAQGRPVDVGQLLEAERLARAPGTGPLTRSSGLNPPAFVGQIEVPVARNGAPSAIDGKAAVYPGDLIGFKSEIRRLQESAAREGRRLELRPNPDGTRSLVEVRGVEWLDQYSDRHTAESALKRMPPPARAGYAVVPVETAARGKGFALIRGLSDRQAAALEKDPTLAERIVDPAPPAAAGTAAPQPLKALGPEGSDPLGAALRATAARKRAPHVDRADAAISARASEAAGQSQAAEGAAVADDLAAVEQDLASIEKEIAAGEKLELLDAADREGLAAADEAVKAADARGKAAQLLGNCLLGVAA